METTDLVTPAATGLRPVLIGVMLAGTALGMTLGAMAPAAAAGTATGPMTVTAAVSSTCTVGASTLAFPSATSAAIAAGNVDATGTVTVNCTSGSAYTIGLDAGSGVGATSALRKMSAGAQTLSYSVYTSAARTSIWGDGTSSSVTVAGVGSGASQSIAAYGRIFAGQIVPAASYTDTINVTITY